MTFATYSFSRCLMLPLRSYSGRDSTTRPSSWKTYSLKNSLLKCEKFRGFLFCRFEHAGRRSWDIATHSHLLWSVFWVLEIAWRPDRLLCCEEEGWIRIELCQTADRASWGNPRRWQSSRLHRRFPFGNEKRWREPFHEWANFIVLDNNN